MPPNNHKKKVKGRGKSGKQVSPLIADQTSVSIVNDSFLVRKNQALWPQELTPRKNAAPQKKFQKLALVVINTIPIDDNYHLKIDLLKKQLIEFLDIYAVDSTYTLKTPALQTEASPTKERINFYTVTLLHLLVIFKPDLDLISTILSYKPDLNIICQCNKPLCNNKTPLQLAFICSTDFGIQAMQLFLDHGTDPNTTIPVIPKIKNIADNLPIGHFVLMRLKNTPNIPPIIACLVRNKVNLNTAVICHQGIGPVTPLVLALLYRSPLNIIELLVEQGNVDLYCTNLPPFLEYPGVAKKDKPNIYWTTLMWALFPLFYQKNVVEYILRKIFQQDPDPNKTKAKALLNWQIPNIKALEGYSALALAVDQNNIEAIQILTQYPIEVTSRILKIVNNMPNRCEILHLLKQDENLNLNQQLITAVQCFVGNSDQMPHIKKLLFEKADPLAKESIEINGQPTQICAIDMALDAIIYFSNPRITSLPTILPNTLQLLNLLILIASQQENAATKLYPQILLKIIAMNLMDTVKIILLQTKNPRICEVTLHYAIATENLPVVEMVLDCNLLNFNTIHSSLIFAIFSKNEAVVSSILKYYKKNNLFTNINVSVTLPTPPSDLPNVIICAENPFFSIPTNPYLAAIISGNKHILKLLLTTTDSIDINYEQNHQLSLFYIVLFDRIDILNYLIDNKLYTDFNPLLEQNLYVLDMAKQYNRSEIISILEQQEYKKNATAKVSLESHAELSYSISRCGFWQQRYDKGLSPRALWREQGWNDAQIVTWQPKRKTQFLLDRNPSSPILTATDTAPLFYQPSLAYTWGNGIISQLSIPKLIQPIINSSGTFFVLQSFEHITDKNFTEEIKNKFAAVTPHMSSTGLGIRHLTGSAKCKVTFKINDELATFTLKYELKITEEKRLFGIRIIGDNGAPPLLLWCFYGDALHKGKIKPALQSLQAKAQATSQRPLILFDIAKKAKQCRDTKFPPSPSPSIVQL